MNYRVEYSDAAKSDLREIGFYLRTVAGDEVAEAIMQEIMDAVETLSVRPERQRRRDHLARGLQAISAKRYSIFYSVRSERVMIVRILHGSRNITARLFPRDER